VTDQPRVRTFYRAVKKYPPRERDYLTPQEVRGDPPEHLAEEQRFSWDALSFFDSEVGVRQQAREVPGIGTFIVRYDIPEDAGSRGRRPSGQGTTTSAESERADSTRDAT
jgi:hypothetical protein